MCVVFITNWSNIGQEKGKKCTQVNNTDGVTKNNDNNYNS